MLNLLKLDLYVFMTTYKLAHFHTLESGFLRKSLMSFNYNLTFNKQHRCKALLYRMHI